GVPGRLSVQLAEDLELDLDPLGHGLDHQVRLADGFVERGVRAQATARFQRVGVGHAASGDPFLEDGADSVRGLFELFAARVLERGGVAAERGDVRDPAAHDPRAKDRDVLDAHARPPSRDTNRHAIGNNPAATADLKMSPGMNGRSPLASSVPGGTNAESCASPRPKMITLPPSMARNIVSGLRSHACSASTPVSAAADGNATR